MSELDLAIIIIEIFISFISITLNLLCIVLISITLGKKRTYSNIIFLLISIADFIVGLISIPGDIFLTYSNKKMPLGIIVCLFYKTFDYGNSGFSLMLLLVITVHRFLQLKDPFKQKEQMNRWRWMLILLLFFSNYGVWLGLSFNYFNQKANKDVCSVKRFDVFIYAFYCASTIGPFILIIIMNGLMTREFIIKKSKKMVRRNKKQDNAIYCILAITANLIICWGLYVIIWPIIKTCKYCVPDNLYTVAYLLNYGFSAVNPILLLVFNQNYRAVLTRKFIQNRNEKTIENTFSLRRN